MLDFPSTGSVTGQLALVLVGVEAAGSAGELSFRWTDPYPFSTFGPFNPFQWSESHV
jgi:hypothetical protein